MKQGRSLPVSTGFGSWRGTWVEAPLVSTTPVPAAGTILQVYGAVHPDAFHIRSALPVWRFTEACGH